MKYLILSSVLLSGCSTLGNMFSSPPAVPVVAPVEIVTIREPAPMYHPPYIENYDAGDAPAVAYYGLTAQAYENLANNLADIRRYIRQNLNIIKYYRDNDPTRDQEED